MKKGFRYILYAFFASMVLSVIGGCRDSRVIDEEDLAQIYSEMLMTDQWISSTPNMRTIADTTLVYEPILRKYGYSSEDYRYSVSYYIDHSDDFEEIIKETISILDARKAALEEEKVRLEAEKETADYIKSMAEYVRLDESLIYANDRSHDKVLYTDTLSVEWDTLICCFKIERVPRLEGEVDTLVFRIPDPVIDSLSVSDKAVGKDTLKIATDTVETPSGLQGATRFERAGFDTEKMRQVKDAYLIKR